MTILLKAIRVSARAALEIQLIDERSLVRQTETGMWKEGVERESKQEEEEETEEFDFSCSRSSPCIIHTTKLGGLGFLRSERPHNSRTPCRTACHTFRTALKSPASASTGQTRRTCLPCPPVGNRRGRDYTAEPAAPGIYRSCRREFSLAQPVFPPFFRP